MGIYEIGKIVVFAGAVLIISGLLLLLISKFTALDRLPGDIFLKKGNYSFYFPIVTSIILSIILTIVLNILLRTK